MFQPDVLCIGGGVSNEGQVIIDMLMPLIKTQIFGKGNKLVTNISLAKLGNEAGIIGAAAFSYSQK